MQITYTEDTGDPIVSFDDPLGQFLFQWLASQPQSPSASSERAYVVPGHSGEKPAIIVDGLFDLDQLATAIKRELGIK